MKVYLSGPISTLIPDVEHEELKERFNSLQRWLRKNFGNWDVVNPLEVQACATLDCNGGQQGAGRYDHAWFCWLKYDLREMLLCDAICLLPGWELSQGAQLESDVAFRVGLSPYYALLDDDKGWSIA
jgi:hypothetical protein